LIATLEHLRATHAYLASMEEGLAELLSKLPKDATPRREILSQPYIEEINRVRAEIDVFLQLRRVGERSESADLKIGLQGRNLKLGLAPISVVTGTVDAIRRGFLALAALLSGRKPGVMGRAWREVEDACDLRLLAVGEGSVTVSLALPATQQLELLPSYSLGGQAAEWFIQVAAWASNEADNVSDASFPSIKTVKPRRRGAPTELSIELAAWQVLKALPREGSPLEAICLEGRLVPQGRILLNKGTRDRLYRIIEKGRKTEERTVTGDLRSLDLDSGTFFLRVPHRSSRLRCLFEPLFQQDVLQAAGHRVKVTGTAVLDSVTGLEKELMAQHVVVLDPDASMLSDSNKRSPRKKTRHKKKRKGRNR
jgi:hypothetical protein